MFENARIKLTLWYLVIIMVVSGFFSLIVYIGFTKELGRGFRYQSMNTGRILVQDSYGFRKILPFVIYPEEIAPEEFGEIVTIAKRRFALQLIIINSGILFLAGTAGYFLAGKTLKPIEVMVSEQKRFIADASHELRTPLTSLKTENEVALRNTKLNLREAKQLIKSNLYEVDKMKYFSDDLLTLSRYETNGKNLKKEKVDLNETVKQAVARNLPLAKAKKIKVIQNEVVISVNGISQSLSELFSILINNAIKYSPNKSEVKIETNKLKRNALVTISDNGIGIGESDLPHIFDRFYRADTSRSKVDHDGYGLGLSIAKSITRMHNGEIVVKSKLGKGTTFKVYLPL